MATEVKLPDLGDGIESGDVLEIFVSVGDVITEGQDIVEMETDKATVPVPASAGGKVTKIVVSEGDSVPIGAVLLEVEAAEGAAQAEAPAEPPAQEAAEPEQEAEPEPEPEPAAQQPAASSQAAPAPQPTTAAPAKPASTASSDAPAPANPPASPAPATGQSTAPGGAIPAGPAVRRFAREVGVDLSRVQGTGEGGRITRDDVLTAVRAASQSAARPAAASTPTGASATATAQQVAPGADLPGTPDVDDHGTIRVERMSKIRKTISKQMHASWSTVPRVTNFDDADITELERLRQSSKEDYAQQGLKLTTMPFLIKAVATALKHHPSINATIDEENEQLIYKEYVNVGIAVDTDRGLVVPVMKNADHMSIPDTTRALADMAGKVRSGQFAVNDLRGGTFTISNLGAIGGQYSTPIVNIPEVAILLVGRSRKLPVVMPDDSIQARLMMPLSLSYDHRLVDGGTAARFLNDVIGYLEAPSRLLLAF
ncbi:pyruvate dehydrogenase [Roseiconus nitratireducens]|uniref:Dihydrolipoamide acetyltransferase component of pyruvate dehydrogenase complex n=1 Tax=Roseiconus nitratireducens TaxID=2605748 RepID=A0A5M6DI62_9BACT|nr:2-oxo acid dehydrogenase subunit E2 [Roseiconus nitratireducens]KAA5546056.1 pyruvate dehydrogenase [Roseiconus nitratireducens]